MNKISSKIKPVLVALAMTLLPTIALAAPPTGQIIATGSTSLHGPNGNEIDCQTTLTGTNIGGVVTITGASFDPPDPACSFIQANNLPWMGSFNSSFTQITINGVEIDVPAQGIMCSGTVQAPFIDSSNTVNFGDSTPLGPCALDGSLTIKPAPE